MRRLRDTLAIMSHRQLVLRSKIGELMAFLDTIRSHHIQSMVVEIDTHEERTYSVDGLRDALSGLAGEVNSSSEANIQALEENTSAIAPMFSELWGGLQKLLPPLLAATNSVR